MIAASLEALTRPGERAGERSAALGRSGGRDVRGSLPCLSPRYSRRMLTCWNTSSRRRRFMNWMRRASAPGLRAAAKAAVSKICAPFRGCLDGCRAVMQSPALVWGWPGNLQRLRQKGKKPRAPAARNVKSASQSSRIWYAMSNSVWPRPIWHIARIYSGLVKNAALRTRVFDMLEDEFCGRAG